MNKIKLIQNLYLFLLIPFLFLLVSSCEDFDEPGKIYKPEESIHVNGAIITSIEPGNGAIAGVRVITILGQNFTSGDTTWVFVGNNSSPLIKSLSDTKIEIYRPTNFGTVEIKVVVPSSIDTIVRIENYNIEVPIDSIQPFLVGSGLPNFSAMEIGKNGTFWTAGNRRIDTVSADGLFFGLYKDRNNGLPSSFGTVTDLKFGRGGFLYALVGRADIYQISTAVADSVKAPLVYANLTSTGGTASKFDFDEQGNIYSGGNGGLYIVTPLTDSTGNAVSTDQYSGVTFVEIRVFNNHVYVADSKNIWRSSINGSTVGTPELLVNLNNVGLDSCTISSINLDIDERVYLCLQNARYSLYVLENDGSVTPFYVDNIIPSAVRQILGGYNSRYFYLNRSGIASGIRMFILGMEKNGAPYYGRDL